MELILVLLVLAVPLFWALNRVSTLERRVDDHARELDRQSLLIARLRSDLNQRAPKAEPPAPQPAPQPPRAEESVPEEVFRPEPPVDQPPARPAAHPKFTPAFARVAEPAPPSALARDWEAILGGSWANKAGVTVLVIGLSLFLQYSLTHLGPGGRIGVGCALSVAMLLSGMWLERRGDWRLYGRGLIGGGWAGLYFTAYAAHALEPARVITSPVLGTILLLGVAAGMVFHSLRYRSQTVTGIAYFAVFGSLAISPLSAFAALAALPLAASLLYIARRYRWSTMVVLGQCFVYALYLIHIGDLGLVPERLISSFIALLVYWVLFEAYELYSVTGARSWQRAAIFLVNSTAVIAIGIIQWLSSGRPHSLWIPLATLSAAFIISAVIRRRRVPDSRTGVDDVFVRALAGGYEGAALLASGLAIGCVYAGAHGHWINAGLLAIAELLLWLGTRDKQVFLRRLSSVAFLFPVAQTLFHDVQLEAVRQWTGAALLTTAVALANRLWRPELVGYSYCAVGLAAVSLGWNLPNAWVPFGLFALSIVVWETGLDVRRRDFRYAALLLSGCAAWLLWPDNVIGKTPWLPELACAGLLAAFSVRAHRVSQWRIRLQAGYARDGAAALAAISAGALAATLLPDYMIAVALFAIVFVLFEAGRRAALPLLRAEAHCMTVAALIALGLFNLLDTTEVWGISRSLLIGAPCLIPLYYLRYRALTGSVTRIELRLTRIYPYLAALLALQIVGSSFDHALVAPGRAVIALALLYFGLRKDDPDFQLQAYGVSVVALANAIQALGDGNSIRGIDVPLIAAVPVVASFYVAQFLIPRSGSGTFLSQARVAYSIAGTALAAGLLAVEVRGSWLTVAWGVEGALALVAGFFASQRVLRLSGLAIFGACIGKLFFWDLRQLSTPYRIISFIVLGLLLLAGSACYTRYRETLREYI